MKKESEALKKIRDAIGTSKFPQMLFDKVFNADVERLRSVEGMWNSRRAPEPLQYETVVAQAKDAIANKGMILSDDQRVWSLEESLAVFNDSLDRLSKRVLELKKNKAPEDPEPTITFDKDDIDTLDFVTASANIRSTIFGIDKKSRFDTKQMAGNIIPAIATTNAIVAGLCVLQSFKVLKGEYAKSKEVFLTPFAPARLLAPDRSREPNPDCPVCGVYFTSVAADLSRATLKDLVDDVVKSKLGFEGKEFVVNNDVGTLVECFEDGDDENLPKKLSELGKTVLNRHVTTLSLTNMTGIKKDSFLTVIDQDDDDTFVNVVINVQEGFVYIPFATKLSLHFIVHLKTTRTLLRSHSQILPTFHVGRRGLSLSNRMVTAKLMERLPMPSLRVSRDRTPTTVIHLSRSSRFQTPAQKLSMWTRTKVGPTVARSSLMTEIQRLKRATRISSDSGLCYVALKPPSRFRTQLLAN